MRGVLATLLATAVLLSGCTFAEESTEPPDDEPAPSTPTATTPAGAAPPDPVASTLSPVSSTPTPSPSPSPPPATPSPTPPALATPIAPAPTAPASPTPASPPVAATPTPTPPAAEWPREGSFVSFSSNTTQSFSGTSQGWRSWANATWTYQDGDWTGVCVSHRVSTDDEGAVTESTETTTYSIASPPHWPIFNTRSPPAPGELVPTWTLRDCEIDESEWPYRGLVDGRHIASSDPDEPPYDFETLWDARTGLVLEWSLHRSMTQAPYSSVGRLTATDAPVS